ncbi:MAG: 23S rRNA (guanosine(2251)-2'-O)-methyltransferase RlmB [Deltaproteobacteria bacterium HGW-Deltaproteobacteria-22]|nr:MAG: 23S rRNA (guanosine(2251)-2'-O)-methyltransferase RlmB [Deltaproteobacteria bacterium HGW-Deltaproteobacteria-22]
MTTKPRPPHPMQNKPPAEDVHVVFGIHPVEELVETGRVQSLLVSSSAPPKLIGAARARGIRVENVFASELDQMTGFGVHQGVVALVEGFEYTDFDHLLTEALTMGPALLVFLDRITDPHNLGAIARSAYLLGAHGLVIPLRESAHPTAGAMKASAGALVHLPVARVHNLKLALTASQEAGLQVIGAAGEAEEDLPGCDLTGPVALVIGSEHQGIRPSVASYCDRTIRIPMCTGGVGSYNASVAAAICLYEAFRQRTAD